MVTGCEVKTVDKTARGWSLDTVKTITKERRIPNDDPRKKPQFKIETKIETEEYTCSKLIIATGGLSYPGTGSTGDGYMWAEELGHSVEPCYPSLTALVPEGYKTEQSALAGEIKQAFRGRTVYGKSKERKITPLPDWYPKFEKHIERIKPLSEVGELFNGNNLENVQLTLFINGEEAFYCGGKDFENAHTAEADTIATYEVLKAQLDRYKEPTEFQQEALKNDVDALAKIGARARNVDFAGRLILNDDGEPTISFGKHKGRTAREVWESEPSYFAWIENGDFTLDTKRQFARLKQQFQRERKESLNRPATADELAGLATKWGGKLF